MHQSYWTQNVCTWRKVTYKNIPSWQTFMTLEVDKIPHWREACAPALSGPKSYAILEDCTQQLLGLGMQTSSTSDECVPMALSPSLSTFQQCMTRRPKVEILAIIFVSIISSQCLKFYLVCTMIWQQNIHSPADCLHTAVSIYSFTPTQPRVAMALEFTPLFYRHPLCFWLWIIYEHLF
jgi:hypothetical protein